ncbi:hypothetical protein WA026_012758 [Henosepilachna vigintioctopunctata]|uniref:Uncharacterized protein n=1 Tax=Henosepilachna vigintioctopunctata TaxID=420089 RepID=A0AAW1U1Q7_9CUCU
MEAIAKQVADPISARIDKTIERINLRIQAMHDEITIIKEENKDLKQKVDELEQDAKLESLRFHGIQESEKEDFKKIVGNIVKSKLEVENVIIRDCYRIGKNSGSKPRVVMGRFGNQFHRNEVFYNRRKPKNSRIVISENITKSRFELLNFAKDKLGTENVWSTFPRGKIFARDGKENKLEV